MYGSLPSTGGIGLSPLSLLLLLIGVVSVVVSYIAKRFRGSEAGEGNDT